MNLGFGAVEQAFEEQEELAIRNKFEELYPSVGSAYITDEIAEELSKWLKDRGREYQKAAVEYREASEYPERYSSYYSYVLHDASHIVVIMDYTHINRCHGMSADGWASCSSKNCFFIEV